MISPARKQTISEEADLFTDETNQRMNETRIPEVVPPRAPTLKLVEGKRQTFIVDINDSGAPPPYSVGAVDRDTEFEFADRREPILNEIDRAAPGRPIFVFHVDDRLDVTSGLDAAGGLQDSLDDYAGIQELQKRPKPRPRGLLWASFICFAIAALFLVALIGQL